MKKILTIFLIFITLSCISGQSTKPNENYASFNLGFGWKDKMPYSQSLHFPSAAIFVERTIKNIDNVGLFSAGGFFGFHYGQHKGTDLITNIKYKEKWTDVFFQARTCFYFQELFYEFDFPDNVALYAGLGLGFDVHSHEIDPEDVYIEDKSGIKFSSDFFFGGRYYIKEHFALSAEFGYGLSYLKLGISYRY